MADLLIGGTAAPHLDALVTRLSLEPGLRTISWQQLDHDTTLVDEPMSAESRRTFSLRRR